jgi:Ran GTPase-activating protein (RanGAP) involved in mRNA processing and transport
MCVCAFCQSSLLHLYFNNDGLQAEAVTALTDLIMQNYPAASADAAPTTQLRTLEIGHNCMEDAGFLALVPLVKASPLLQTLRISTTRVRNNLGGGVAMCRTLLDLHHLRSLSLNDNNLGEESGAVLAQVIRNNAAHLAFLNLGDIGVGEEGIAAVMAAIADIKPNTLTHLDLSANELTPSSVRVLARIARRHSASLQHLKLEDNELKSGGVLRLLRDLAKCKQLTYLNLNNNQLGERCGSALVRFLAAMPQLREVHLNGNRFSAATLEAIQTAVAQASGEDALATMSDNDEDDEDEDEGDEEEAEVSDEEDVAAQADKAEAEEAEEDKAEAKAAADADKDVEALTAGLAATTV